MEEKKKKSFEQMVGERIKEERLRLKRENGKPHTQESFAELLDVSKQTINNLENGTTDIKVNYLYKIKEKCGCDIGYLLGECENRTYVATDVCKATGLSEEATTVLIRANKRPVLDKKIWNEDIYSKEELEEIKKNNDEESRTFIDLINRIIESRGFDYSDDLMDFIDENSLSYVLVNTVLSQKAEGCFPINQLVEYVIKVRRANSYKSHRGYLDFIKVFRDNPSFFSYNTDIESICEQLKERGYTREEIESAKDVFKGFKFDDYEFEKKNKRYLRIDIQDSFSEFLKSDFVEGENNGK